MSGKKKVILVSDRTHRRLKKEAKRQGKKLFYFTNEVVNKALNLMELESKN